MVRMLTWWVSRSSSAPVSRSDPRTWSIAGGSILYADTGGGPGSIYEVLEAEPPIYAMFDRVRQASIGWDGSDPIRRLR